MDLPDVINEYDEYVGPGSELVVLAMEAVEKREALMARLVEGPLKNIRVVHRVGSPLHSSDVEAAIFDSDSIFKAHMNPKRGRAVFEDVPFSISSISGGSWRAKDMKPDKESMYSLFLAALVCNKRNVRVQNLTAEFQETKLAREALCLHPSLQYVCTNDLMALLAARVSEQLELNAVWTELLHSWGNEFYVKDINLYVVKGEQPTFAELAERARSWDEVAVGYRRDGVDVINPCPKDAPLSLSTTDRLIVIAETEITNMQR